MKRKLTNMLMVLGLLANIIVSLVPQQVFAVDQDNVKDAGNVYTDLSGDYGLLGIASQFHIFTSGTAYVGGHVYGNVAAKKVDGGSNFGTPNFIGDINYIQGISNINASSGLDNPDNKFVVGNNIAIDFINANQTKLDSQIMSHLNANNLYQDKGSNVYIDFETEFDYLEGVSGDLKKRTVSQSYGSDHFDGVDQNNRRIDVSHLPASSDGVVYLNMDAQLLMMNTPLYFTNTSQRMVVINVTGSQGDLSLQSPIKYTDHKGDRGSKETIDFSDSNVLWNFGSAVRTVTFNAVHIGSVLAPRANVVTTQNFDGSIMAANVAIGAESHRWDPNPIPTEISVKGEKIWQDNQGANGNRPDSITLYLLAGTDRETAISDFLNSGVAIDSHTFDVAQTVDWSYRFTGLTALPAGQQYFIYEEKADFYQEPQVNGYQVTNAEELTEIPVTKKWQDNNNQYQNRPKNIQLYLFEAASQAEAQQLFATDPNQAVATHLLSGDPQADDWHHTFKDLPKYRNKQLISYQVVEAPVTGYELPAYNGYMITNQELPKTSVSYRKIWDDFSNRYLNRPEDLELILLKGDTREAAMSAYTMEKIIMWH